MQKFKSIINIFEIARTSGQAKLASDFYLMSPKCQSEVNKWIKDELLIFIEYLSPGVSKYLEPDSSEYWNCSDLERWINQTKFSLVDGYLDYKKFSSLDDDFFYTRLNNFLETDTYQLTGMHIDISQYGIDHVGETLADLYQYLVDQGEACKHIVDEFFGTEELTSLEKDYLDSFSF